MTILIVIFGALTFLTGLIIIFNPENIFGLLSKHSDKLEMQILAIVVRLVLGVLLVYHSGVSKYPLIIEIIGWLSIVAAIFFAVIGRNNFRRLISWALSLAKPFGRVGGFVAVCFGAFLVYAFV
jgi:hypothetical protein